MTIRNVRRYLLVLASFLASLVALPESTIAAPVDAAAAREAAATFLESLGTPRAEFVRQIDVADVADAVDGRRRLAYIFRLAPRGYVAVGADDALPPVIAYSLESEYPSEAAADNPLLRLLTVDLRSRLQALPSLDAAAAESWRRAWSELAEGARERGERFEQWPPAGSTPTGGWLHGNWTQNAPYNSQCPLDLAHGGTRSLAGCPAVAMAMILDFHGTIQATAFGSTDRYWHAYAGNNYWIPDAAAQYGFPNFATLNGSLQTVTLHWDQGAPLTNMDKAAVTFACGVAARQVYSASGSGTFGVDQAYDAYQRFAFGDSRLAFDSDPELYSDLASNMRNALPAHLAVVDPGWTMGHNVVVDGYNTDNYFHLNFGWGGAYNGWYLLPQEIPYGLTVVEGVVLDIEPTPTTAPEVAAPTALFALASHPNPGGLRISLSFTAPVAGRARLDLYDATGRLRAVLLNGEIPAGPQSFSVHPEHLAAGVYLARLAMGGRVESRRLVVAH